MDSIFEDRVVDVVIVVVIVVFFMFYDTFYHFRNLIM